jgi:hypothetical protein
MSYVVEFPVAGGGVLRVEGTEEDIPSGLELAANQPAAGPLIARAPETVQAALDELTPAINATTERLKGFKADEVTVEFGLLLGIEGGVIIAKGTAEAHFNVTLTWKRPDGDG